MGSDELNQSGLMPAVRAAPGLAAARLRLAVLVSPSRFTRATVELLELLRASPDADGVVLLVLAGPADAVSAIPISLRRFLRLDARLAGSADLAAPAPLPDAGAGLQVLTAADELEAVPLLAAAGPDLLVTVYDGPCPRALAQTLRKPLWQCDLGTESDEPQALVGVREFFTRSPEVFVTLRRLGATAVDDVVLGQTVLRADRDRFLVNTRQRVIAEANQLVLMAVCALRRNSLPLASAQQRREVAKAALPGVERLLSTFAAPFVRRARRIVSRSRARPVIWKVALRPRQGRAQDDVLTRRDDFTLLESPQGFAWADPHLVAHQGRTLLFVEELEISREASGKLVCLEIDGRGAVAGRAVCVQRPYHLSFPQVFLWQGEYFMIPESMADGSVQLLRARHFPDDWVLEKVLFRGSAVDTVAWPDTATGEWRFITSMGCFAGQFPMTMVFNADSLTGDWRLHPASPIGTDVRLERNAGALFRSGTRLIRPVQDGRLRYGHAMQWQEITRFDAQGYEERPCGRIEPDWAPGVVATHSYTSTDQWEALDALVLQG